MDSMESFGSWLKWRRKVQNLTQDDLAARAGCAVVTLRKIESDERRPSLELARLLAVHLGLPDELHATFLKCARGELSVDRLLSQANAPAAPHSSGVVTVLAIELEGGGPDLGGPAQLVQRVIGAYGGQLLRRERATVWASFAHALPALVAALATQRELQAAAAAAKARAVLHSGLAQETAGQLRGSPLQHATQLLSVCPSGQLLLSAAAYAQVADNLPPDVQLRDLGQLATGHQGRPEQLYQALPADLPEAPPPPPRAARQRTNLRPPLTTMVGREREAAELRGLLTSPPVRLVTLLGPGGVGKTRLALQVAHDLLDAFADGVFMVDLAAARDPRQVASAIHQALGIREEGGQQLQRLTAALADQQTLLLLDNFEQVLDATALLDELLAAAPDLKLLITSRLVLPLHGAHTLRVPPLALPDAEGQPDMEQLAQCEAVQLFAARTQLVKSDFALSQDNIHAVAEICRRLDGLPLAIELAAARGALLSPQALLQRLERRLSLLATNAANLPARQQTLRNTIDWSYQLLSPEDQALFARLAVFVGGCTLEAAEAVCGLGPADDVLEGVASLLEKSMLQRQEDVGGQPQLVMLETIREYALEQLDLRGELDSMRWRHARYYQSRTQGAEHELESGRQLVWLDWIALEQHNLHGALEWLLACGDTAAALALGGVLGHFWAIRGHLSEGQRWLERVLSLDIPPEQLAAKARCQHALGMILALGGRYEQALEQLTQAYQACEATGDYQQRGAISGWIANVYKDQGCYDQALDWLEQRLRAARATSDSYEMSIALNNMGLVYHEQGEHQRALTCFEEGLRLAMREGKQTLVAKLLGNMGLAYEALGDYAHALDYFEQFYAVASRLGFRLGMCVAMGNMGNIYLQQGRDAQALACVQEYLDLALAIDNPLDVGIALGYLAQLASRHQRSADADDLWHASLTLLRRTKNPYFLCCYLQMYAEDRAALGHHEEALRCNTEALRLADQHGLKDTQFRALLLDVKLQLLLDVTDSSTALARLEQLRPTWTAPLEQAAGAYTAWWLDRSLEHERKQAAEVYCQLLERTPNIEYAQRYKELTGGLLTAPTALLPNAEPPAALAHTLAHHTGEAIQRVRPLLKSYLKAHAI